MNISITCTGSHYIDYRQFHSMQGDLFAYDMGLKTITQENIEKLKNSIINLGFSAPIFIWLDTNTNQYTIIDGHQRTRALHELYHEGYALISNEGIKTYNVPCIMVEATNIHDAAQRLLSISSQYGEFDTTQLKYFIAEHKIPIDYLSMNVLDDDMHYAIPNATMPLVLDSAEEDRLINMTFTVSHHEMNIIKQAIHMIIANNDLTNSDAINNNKNGNALCFMAQAYMHNNNS